MHHKIPYHIADAKESNDELRPRAFEKNESFMDSRSFFNCSPSDTEVFTPIDPLVHKPITISQFFRTKLRWMTLGGQYDWTEKKYPNVDHPAFPEDIANFIRGLFPEMNPEAAIVNVYSPGNTLSLHRDVSEESDHGLVSISLGCDGIFIVGIEEMGNNRAKSLVIRLRSGDAVYMSGPSRYAWHGIPLIVPNTCPDWLEAWPARESDVKTAERMETQNHEAWRGWMANKRINLNVRQMKDHRPCPV
ncbi:hypothetical protein MMC24_001331 [Lignoscripta atroalba]|nr:hypothetical protein [Lignoscripta atroalba]